MQPAGRGEASSRWGGTVNLQRGGEDGEKGPLRAGRSRRGDWVWPAPDGLVYRVTISRARTAGSAPLAGRPAGRIVTVVKPLSSPRDWSWRTVAEIS